MPLSLSARRYRLPLNRALSAGSASVVVREGFVVALSDSASHTGYGEAAPCPGVHDETIDAVAAELARLVGLPWSEAVDDRATWAAIVAARTATPSLRFALESAGAHLAAQRGGATVAQQIGVRRDAVAVNALFDGGPVEAMRALDEGALAAFRCVKVKVGRRPLAEERRMLEVLMRGLAPDTVLRLDANRTLSLEDACALLTAVPAERIAYAEEPLREPWRLSELFARTGVRSALDESRREPGLEALWCDPAVAAWVVKPGREGALHGTQQLAARAEAHGIACVVSACFESGLGLWMLATLAASLPSDTPAGLATDLWLARDVVTPPFTSARGRVTLADAVYSP